MKSSNVKESVVKKRRSILRTILIILSLVPAWHFMGRNLFELSAQDADGSQENIRGAYLEKSKMLPYPSDPIDFVATAYCEKGITKSGVPVATGLVAGDPHVLPLGSWIKVDGPICSGIYQVMDTGRLVKGKKIDIYMPTYGEAMDFGVRKVSVTVLKYGQIRLTPLPLYSTVRTSSNQALQQVLPVPSVSPL